MDKLIIPASITLESCILNRKYSWKSDLKRETIYKTISKRAFVRFSCKNLSCKLSRLKFDNRRIDVNFIDDKNLIIQRKKDGKFSMQGYGGAHPQVQFVVNSALPEDMRRKFGTKSRSYPINVFIFPDEWAEFNLSPADFLIEVERESKSLLNAALRNGFTINKISKGREFDLSLINRNNEELVLALSSHVASNKSRSKKKTIQKILMDICKMLPYLDKNKKAIPIIITRPIEFEGSWSFTTQGYLDFYRDKFNFRFITTEFKKGWEDKIIKELSKI